MNYNVLDSAKQWNGYMRISLTELFLNSQATTMKSHTFVSVAFSVNTVVLDRMKSGEK